MYTSTHPYAYAINPHEHIRETRLTNFEINKLNTCMPLRAMGMYQLLATKRIISCKCEQPRQVSDLNLVDKFHHKKPS